tara:strand:+ start:119 stop:475 length:357 start_codon:yes stop_codon:yes gene_type:complete
MYKKKIIYTAMALGLASAAGAQELYEVTGVIHETNGYTHIFTDNRFVRTDLEIGVDSVYFWEGVGEYGRMVQTTAIDILDVIEFREGNNYEGIPYEITMQLGEEVFTYLLYDLQNQYE